MGMTCKSMFLGTALLFASSADAPAYHLDHNVVRPLYGFSFNYGYPALHRYQHHYLPENYYGSPRSQGFGGQSGYENFFRGRYNDHRPYYYQHPYSHYYRGGSSLFFRF